MAWVLMLETHNRVWGPGGPGDRRLTTRYLKGSRYPVTKDVAEELVEQAGVAVRIRAPHRDELPPGLTRVGAPGRRRANAVREDS